jgi:AAA15 family ATPase/GTPase
MSLQRKRGKVVMLLQFKFKNYRSFSEETTLNMMAASIKEHNNSLIEVNGNKILPIAAVFGANAGGKSNFFNAFAAMSKDVVIEMNKKVQHTWIVPFAFDTKLSDQPSEFEVSIYVKEDNKEYRYGFSRNQTVVFEEWLFEKNFTKNSQVQEKEVFYRVDNKINIQALTKEKTEIEFVFSMIDESELLLNALGKRDKSKYSKIYEWFYLMTFRNNYSYDLNDWTNTKELTRFLFDKKEVQEMILSLLQDVDDSILKLDVIKNEEKKDSYEIITLHKCNGGKEIWISLEEESSGTRKLFSLALDLIIASDVGKVLFIDELDSKLHPLLLRYIIKLFRNKSKNTGGGQLIFSSHNLICLDSSDLRRDEIWFVEKVNQASSIYSLYDFKEDEGSIRSDLSFGKHYLSGRFGAIPFQNSEK